MHQIANLFDEQTAMARIREAVDHYEARFTSHEAEIEDGAPDAGEMDLTLEDKCYKLGSSDREQPIASVELRELSGSKRLHLEKKLRRFIARTEAGERLRELKGIERVHLDNGMVSTHQPYCESF